jgi:hypothetical protein
VPYPYSRYVKGVAWDFIKVQSEAHGSDLWPCAWAADDNLYCAWGDGGGFDGNSDDIGRVSLGFARIVGMPSDDDPDSFRGKNVWGAAPAYAEHQATFGGKVGTMISVDGTLYAFGSFWTDENTHDPIHHSEQGPLSTLIWSSDLGASWQMVPWRTARWGSFLNFGRDNENAPDSYVYIYYERAGDPTRAYLKRVPKTGLKENPEVSYQYEYLIAVGRHGSAPIWGALEANAMPVFVDPQGVDLNVVYDAPLGRYLLTSGHNPLGKAATASMGQMGFFEGPHPWGPWATIGYYADWGEFGPESHGDYLGVILYPKWISRDGCTLWAVFSGPRQYDAFNIVKARLSLRESARHKLRSR